MAIARFPVVAHLDSAGGKQKGTVEIDRESGLFSVRPHRRQRKFTMPLSMVADMVVQRIVHNELQEKKRAKKAHRKTGAAA